MGKRDLLILAFLVAAAHHAAAGFRAEDALNADGSLKEEFEFKQGKYFLKQGHSLIRALDAASALYYSQQKDHFGNVAGTYQQRYWVNDDYYRPGGPLFFMLGAEGNAEYDADGGQWLWYAQALGAHCVAIEHRFYGESIPTTDTSNAGMQIHSSQQALADAATFIRWYKAQNGLNGVKTVLFGGSYGGNLVAWARELYPNDFNIGVSSSGPVNATFDMTQYYETVSEVIYEVDSSCYSKVGEAFYCMQLVAAGYTGCSQAVQTKQQLLEYTNYCYPVNWASASSKANFFNWQATGVWGSNAPGTQAKTRCKNLLACTSANQDIMVAYKCFLDSIGMTKAKCSEGGGIGRRKRREAPEGPDTSFGVLDAKSDSDNWFWQTCNEFGYYQGADPRYCLFGCNTWKYNIYSDQCYSKYGSKYTETYIRGRVDNTNKQYMGTRNTGTCIIFVNGDWDPWHKLGVTSAAQTSSKNSVVMIRTGEHCDDMSNGAGKRNQYVGQAQVTIQNLIKQYLADPTC